MISDTTSGILAAAAFLLLVAGASKIRGRKEFVSQIRAYAVVPYGAAAVLGQALPFIEVATAVVVFADPQLGGLFVAALFSSFGGAMTLNLLRGRRELVCGCFGPSGRRTITWTHAVANFVLAAAGAGAALGHIGPTLPTAIAGISVLLAAFVVESVLNSAMSPPVASNEERY